MPASVPLVGEQPGARAGLAAADQAIGLPSSFVVHLSEAEETRLIREPGDRALLEAILARTCHATTEAVAKAVAASVTASVTASWPSQIRAVVEALASHGNSHAVAALLIETRLAGEARAKAESAPPMRVIAEVVMPQGSVVNQIELPPRDTKVTFTRDSSGRLDGANTSTSTSDDATFLASLKSAF